MLRSTTSAFLIITISVSFQQLSLAQTYTKPDQISDSSRTDDIEIAGIVIDATQTKIGKDFYELFYQQWNELDHTLSLINSILTWK